MEATAEIDRFEIGPIIEQTPFEDPGVQKFFGEWCKVNDGIKPKFIDRKKWDRKGGMNNVLKETWSRDKKVLSIPKDLYLWEMVDVMEAVDNDTFSDNPEQRPNKKEEIVSLGHMFESAGVYIAQRLDAIDHGKGIAEDLAVQFYDYGQSLVGGKKANTKSNLDEIANLAIPDEELDEVDRWLAGDEFYARKIGQLNKVLASRPEQRVQLFEDARADALNRYFKVADVAFERQLKTDRGETVLANATELKPWESATPIHTGFIDKSKGNIQRSMEAPKRELVGSIFRRGIAQIQEKMPFDKLPRIIQEALDGWGENEKNLRDLLEIDDKKQMLGILRERGDMKALAAAELDFAEIIQATVSTFPGREGAKYPSGLVSTQEMDCLGASLVGGAFLSELGINYLAVNYPEHASIFVITSTGQIESLDMVGTIENFTLNDETVSGMDSDGSEITVERIAEFARDPSRTSLKLELSSDPYEGYLSEFKHRKSPLVVYKPEIGNRIFTLNGLGNVLGHNKDSDAAIKCFKEAIDLDPNYANAYFNLGATLAGLGETKEAEEACKKAIRLKPEEPDAYAQLGLILILQNRDEDALLCFDKFLELADPEIDDRYINTVNDSIARLKRKLNKM